MAVSAAEHLAQALHNEHLLELLIQDVVPTRPEFSDWAFTIMFYGALHYAAGGLMRDKQVTPPDHHGTYRDRAGTIQHGMGDLVSKHYGVGVAPSYFLLYDLSHDARYLPLYLNYRDGRSAVNAVQLNRYHLEIVKAACS